MPAPKVGAGPGILILAVVSLWFLTRGDHKSTPEPPAQSAPQETGDTDVSQKYSALDPITRQSERSDLEITNQKFTEEKTKLLSLSNEDRFGPYKVEVDSLISDAELFHDMAKSAYSACIDASTDATVSNDCWRDEFGFRQSWTALFVDNLLSQLPDISKEHLQEDLAGFFAPVSKNRSDAASLLSKLKSDPNAALRYGISIGELEPLFQRAVEYEDRAQSAEDSDQVLSYILIYHSRLLFDELGWRTWDLSLAH